MTLLRHSSARPAAHQSIPAISNQAPYLIRQSDDDWHCRFLIRPAHENDHSAILAIAAQVGAGFTSLQNDQPFVEKLLRESVSSLETGYGKTLLVLERLADSQIVGCAAITNPKSPRPFFRNFCEKNGALNITDKYAGATELGSLFVLPDARMGGIGKKLSLARLLFIATAPAVFSDTIFSELRGAIKTDDTSAFFDGITRPFTSKPLIELERLSASETVALYTQLLRTKTIRIERLPRSARSAIGACHQSGVGAKKTLFSEGFEYDGVFDLIDGGPLLAAKRSQIKSLTQRLVLPCKIGATRETRILRDQPAHPLLLSNHCRQHFRACWSVGQIAQNHILISKQTAKTLGVQDAQSICALRLSSSVSRTQPI